VDYFTDATRSLQLGRRFCRCSNDALCHQRQVGSGVNPPSLPTGVSVGITNTRLEASKRGIAVEVARRLAASTGARVCLVGADPTDRDVERRTPALIAADSDYTVRQVRSGLRSMEVVFLGQHGLCVVSLPDRNGVEAVLPELRGMFPYVVVDAPSRVGRSVGIGHTLPNQLDALIVASTFAPGDLALTRLYVEGLKQIPRTEHLDVRVVLSGHAHDTRLSPAQVTQRLETLPVLTTVPRLWGRRGSGDGHPTREELDDALAPVVEWIAARDRLTESFPDAAELLRTALPAGRHVAARVYEQNAFDLLELED
jgi:hypothetical protein